jgi:DNA-binding CsgD family transcriptional regulator
MCNHGNENQALKEVEIPSEKQWIPSIQRLRLSPRQKQIVLLLMKGDRDKTIAYSMGLSYNTIRTYLQRIYHKVGVTDRGELMLRVFEVRLKDRPGRGSGDS